MFVLLIKLIKMYVFNLPKNMTLLCHKPRCDLHLLAYPLPSINPVFPVWAAGGLSAWERAARHVVPPPTEPGPTLPPVFDPRVSNNVTVTATKTARLSCIVHNLGNNSVTMPPHLSDWRLILTDDV